MKKIILEIKKKAKIIGKEVRFMELCGTHAETIAKNGIKNILPKNIKLISGPGCPICVTDQEDIDIVVGLAQSGVPVACYGDAANIPGNGGSLETARSKGAQVYIIYDVKEAVEIAKKVRNLIFWGIGFETTAPATAWAIKNGLTVFSSHKLFPPAMEALIFNKNIKIDGFINPGHVSAIIGTEIYKKFKVPQVVAGFEALDVLLAIEKLIEQIMDKKYRVENIYSRLVKKGGNKKATDLINEVFEIRDSRWRGIGLIKDSGLKIREKFKRQDAQCLYGDLIEKLKKNVERKADACRCGEVLQGLIEPGSCPLFKKICTPENPQGACMVSSEGSCNIKFRFE